jgi:hypothetical protein
MRRCELEHHDSGKLDDVLRKHKSFKPTPEYHICIRPPLSFVERQKPWLMMNESKKKKRNVVVDDDDDDDKNVDEENDGNVVHSKMGIVRSNTYHHNCQRKVLISGVKGQV